MARRKYNPALLRLELLSQGIKVAHEFSEQLGCALKEPLWTRTGPTSTGIDLMLEKGHYVSPAIEGERFPYHYKNSPFVLTIDDEKRPVIKKNGEIFNMSNRFPAQTSMERRPAPVSLWRKSELSPEIFWLSPSTIAAGSGAITGTIIWSTTRKNNANTAASG